MLDLNLQGAPQIVGQLEMEPAITFYLTGSRLFGEHRPNSDWDYVTKDDPQTASFLQQIGFKPIKYAPYTSDCDVRVVYRYTSLAAQVDIQLVGDIDQRQEIQRALLDTDALRHLNKIQRARVWRSLYRAVRIGTSQSPQKSPSGLMRAVDHMRTMKAEKALLTCTCGADSTSFTKGCHSSYCDLVTGMRST